MEEPGVFAAFVALMKTLINFAWTGFAALLDLTRDTGPLKALLALVVVVALSFGISIWMQSRLNRKLSDAPKEPVNMFLQELMFTIPGMAIRIVLAPFIYVINLFRRTRNKIRKTVEGEQIAKEAAQTEGGEGGSQEQATETLDPVLVASIGPSFLGASIIIALLYLLGLLTEPLLRYQMETTPGLSAWEVLLLGSRPEMQWYIPLHRYPWMGGVLTLLFWGSIWWQIARIWRLSHFKFLGHNLVNDANDYNTLPWWRTYFGATQLWRPDQTYLRWAKYLPMASAPFLLGAWAALGLMPYPMSASMFSISLLLAFGWVLHMNLEGVYRPKEEEAPEEKPPVEMADANSWEGVLDDLEEKFQISPPAMFEAPRVIEPLAMSSIDLRQEGVISDLLLELMPQPKQLTFMQYSVLRTLSLLGYVHTDAPLPKGELEIGSAQNFQEDEGSRHRNQIVLAPEGMGKSMLAMLAACNHAILHTRSTLVVLRDEAQAQSFTRRVQSALSSSTLRWNIRTRLVGGDLAQDLAQGIIPDIVVCSMRQLVLNVLGESQTYRPILENIGLIVLDDVETFCGPIEVHTQLAMRRLLSRLREIASAEDADSPTMPMTLVLGTDTMHDTPAWVRSLCGIDAVSRYFDYSASEAQVRERALKAFHGLEVEEDKDLLEEQGALQLIYRLSDFKNADDESLSVNELIDACERLAVPWHYRPCGDTKRHLGRSLLYLRDEPKYYMASPLEAGVILLQGHWSEVQREIRRLCRAGAHFDPSRGSAAPAEPSEDGAHENTSAPVSIVTIIDQDEEMALTEFNENSSLKAALQMLPRPVVRPPVGETVQEHLAAELTSNWIEVKDVLEIFGNSTARTLSRLADMSVLMSEERVALSSDIQAYDRRVYVRATSRAVGASAKAGESLLPGRVSQVELLSNQRVALRDRTSLNRIGEADATSAWHTYYTGRIFENAGGRFVVVGRDQGNQDAGLVAQDILIEPYLGDAISSPRRRTWVYHCSSEEAPKIHESIGKEWPPEPRSIEPVLIGDFPVAISLGQVSCMTQHIATYRLGPHSGEIRQRTLLDATHDDGTPVAPLLLSTTALGLYPNPEGSADQPELRLEEARLIASAMRAMLPTMYRGSEDALEIALHVHAKRPLADHVLGKGEGFFFYEPQPGGTGAARALRRDGVDLLLRLCRVYIERVLYHDRLRAHYDYWGDEQEVVEGPVDEDLPTGATGTWFVNDKEGSQPSDDEPLTKRERDRQIRQAALIWLDSRLRPEGSLSGGRKAGTYGSGQEEGEGDIFDIGRCWYSTTGDITQLIWAKHRWRLDDQGGEAMLDLAFDRKTVSQARFLGPEHEKLGPLIRTMTEAIEESETAPAPVMLSARGREEVSQTNESLLGDEQMLAYQIMANAMVLHDYHILGPLASMLRDRSQTDPSTPLGRMALIDYISRFVQGIPSTAVGETRLLNKPPVYALLHRLADEDSKSVILSILLAHCGVDAGIFVSLEEGRAIGGIALFDGSQSDTAGRIQELYTSARRKPPEPVVWAEVPTQSGGTTKQRIFLPVEVTGSYRPGFVSFEAVEGWTFVSLASAWQRVREEKAEENLL